MVIKNISSAAMIASLTLAMSAFYQFALAPLTYAKQPPAHKWFKICAKQDESDVCNVQYRVAASTGQVIKSVNLFTVTGKINRRIFQLVVPTSRHIPAGVAIKIYAKKEYRIPYMHCFRELCTAEIKLDEKLISLLKSSRNILLTTTNDQYKTSQTKIPLAGFKAAFDGPPIEKSALDKENEKLQKLLEKRRKEKKLLIIADEENS